jgi:hypothetical protein
VPVRVGDHGLEQAAVRLLDLPPPSELGLRFLQPRRKAIPHALQLGNPEHAGTACRADRPLDALTGERRREQLTEPPFEDADLPAKVLAGSAPGEEIRGALCERQACSVCRLRRPLGRLDLQQFVGHRASFRPESTTRVF